MRNRRESVRVICPSCQWSSSRCAQLEIGFGTCPHCQVPLQRYQPFGKRYQKARESYEAQGEK
jgi:hypothetical protein